MYVTHDQVEAMTLADRVVILNKGRIEQVGTPMEVYAAPANLFVAGFIGSPAMNMIPAEFTRPRRDSLASRRRGVVAARSTQCHGVRARHESRLGIRPEDIAVLPPGAEAPASVEGSVTTVEPLGAEFLLSFALGPHEIMAKIAGRALPKVGDRLRFAFNMGHAHVFDAATGRSLRRRSWRGEPPIPRPPRTRCRSQDIPTPALR